MTDFDDAMRWASKVAASPSLEDRFAHLSPVGNGGKAVHKVVCQDDSCGGCYPAASSPRGLAITAARASR